jgi:type II secretory pathway pseudopilin PulG
MLKRNIKDLGFSIVEVLIMIAIFAVLVTLTTQSIILSIRGSRKAEAITRVEQNIDYAFEVMERNLHNAKSISCSGTPPSVEYEDQDENIVTFSCQGLTGADSYIASASSRLTSEEVYIDVCSFTCTPEIAGVPPSVSIDIEAHASDYQGAEAAEIATSTQINLRTY